MYTPDNNTFENLFQSAFRAATAAGKRILEIYESDDFQVSMKSDNSPLSLADRDAHNIIKRHLQNSCIPILSEEGRDLQFEERQSWDVLWIVDPLDGTRQFIQKREEFTVNIALITGGSPWFGLIYAPALGDMYFGVKDIGSFKIKMDETLPSLPFGKIVEKSEKLPSPVKNEEKYTILVSYNHLNEKTMEYIAELGKIHPEIEVRKIGSSLKMCLLAAGTGDVYVRHTDTYEWDTAAAQAILEGAGWSIYSLDADKPLTYNKESLLNPYFVCRKTIPQP
ncbi:MAG: 3'(2'),5'-bisphosphate nucleotidase CysQ [Prevotellaceae bacterium]|jgi:3'(2'), 5'-bisphosphate nucleotidase|nr:3'(2'),5'-bisphosphate nucleotidase CysQ [Prevotellaceae bacterium]